MTGEFVCSHCESVIADAADRGDTLTTCPFCHAALPDRSRPSNATPSAHSAALGPSATIRFTLTCDRCGSLLEATSAQSGHTARCPTCGATFVVPAVDPLTGLPAGRMVAADDGQPPLPMHAYAAAGARAPRIERRDDGSQAIVCPRCSARCPVDAELCAACSTPFTLEGAADAGPLANRVSRPALAAALIGLLVCLPLGPVAIALGVWALRRADRRRSQRGSRRAAWIGIVAGAASTAAWATGWLGRY